MPTIVITLEDLILDPEADAPSAAGFVGEHKSTHSLRHSAITGAIRNGAAPMQV